MAFCDQNHIHSVLLLTSKCTISQIAPFVSVFSTNLLHKSLFNKKNLEAKPSYLQLFKWTRNRCNDIANSAIFIELEMCIFKEALSQADSFEMGLSTFLGTPILTASSATGNFTLSCYLFFLFCSFSADLHLHIAFIESILPWDGGCPRCRVSYHKEAGCTWVIKLTDEQKWGVTRIFQFVSIEYVVSKNWRHGWGTKN